MTEPARVRPTDAVILPGLLDLTAEAAAAAEALLARARARVAARVSAGGRVSNQALEAEQSAAHALAWLATYVESLRQLRAWAGRLDASGAFGETEALILQIGFGEYLWQLYGGIPMSQNEIARPQDIGLSQDDQRALMIPAVQALTQAGNTDAARARLVDLMLARGAAASYGATGLDHDYEMIRDQFRRFADDKVVPVRPRRGTCKDELIPMSIIEEMGELGVFGLTIPEEYGGLGMSKTAMCVVSEELSRGYIGVGSLGTRSEIAAELILCGGTEAQKRHWLPKIATAEILPTAVFTEPNTGSDLGALRTRAARDGDDYVDHRQQDLDHPRRPHRRDDDAGAHRSGHHRLFRPVHAAGREAARHGRRSLPRPGHDRRRDRGARLPRHEGVRARLRRLPRRQPRTCSAASRARASSS